MGRSQSGLSTPSNASRWSELLKDAVVRRREHKYVAWKSVIEIRFFIVLQLTSLALVLSLGSQRTLNDIEISQKAKLLIELLTSWKCNKTGVTMTQRNSKADEEWRLLG
jgi:hypothetical protein